MSNPITISTATQGASTATPQAQASGKGTGFLGMLMAAIGHQPTADSGMQATNASTGAKSVHTKASVLIDATAKSSDGKPQGASTLLAKAGDNATQATKTKAEQAKASSLTEAAAQAEAAARVTAAVQAAADEAKGEATLLAKAESHAAQDAKATKAKAASLAAADEAKGEATLLAKAESHATQDAKATKDKAGQADVAKHHGAKNPHHRSDGQTGDASGTTTAAALASLPQAAATPPVPSASQHDAQAVASATDTHAHAQGRASVPMEGSAGYAAQAATAATRMQGQADQTASAGASGTALPQASSDASIGKAAAAMAESAKASSSAAASAATATPLQDAAGASQPTVEIAAAAGMQAEGPQRGIGSAAKAPPHTRAASEASAGKNAKAGQTLATTATAQADAQAQDGAAANSHANASDTAGSAHVPVSQAGIHSYGQVAGGQTRHLPAQATLISHADRSASVHTDTATGQVSAAGQTPTTGNLAMAANAGIGQAIQTTGTTQPPLPQAPTHVSGPWTAMAAMAEIGQAAANGHTRLELKLEPAHLGKVHVRIDSDRRKNIQVHLVVEQPNSRQIIEQQLPNLRHALEQQGLNLGNFSMSSQQQGNGQGSGQPAPQAIAANAPSFSSTPAATPHVLSAPSEALGAGRLSIRI